MIETHISYEVSKRLKEFLGDSAPNPINKEYWWEQKNSINGDTPGARLVHCDMPLSVDTPAYQLHDLLSKPFCAAFMKELDYDGEVTMSNEGLSRHLGNSYFVGGLPAVEKALCEMMEDK